MSDNKLFWKILEPSFIGKTLKNKRITLVEKKTVILEDANLVEIYREYLRNIVKKLGITKTALYTFNKDLIKNPNGKCKNHRTGLNIMTSDNARQRIELCPTKAASQRTQLSGVKLKKKFISYQRFKTHMHVVSIPLS